MAPVLKLLKNSDLNLLLTISITVTCFLVFILDLQFPLGIAGGVPYALFVMGTYWNKSRRVTIGMGILSTVLIIIGFLASKSSDHIVMAGVNRALAIVVVWGAAWFVTQHKTSVYQIRKNEERITALFEAATEGMLISDLNGNIVMLNEKIEELFGYSRDELIGKKVECLVPGPHKKEHIAHRHEYYKDMKPRPMGKGRDLNGVKKSGEEFPVEISLNFFETDEGKFIISFLNDISQRKEAEKEMKEQEQRYRTMFDALTDEILVFQVDKQMKPHTFTEVNNVACEILGYEREELLQRTIYDVVDATKEEVDDRIQHIIEHGKVLWETQHLTKEGNVVSLEISARAFSFNGTKTIISIGRDVRELRKLEKEILKISEAERRRIGRDMHDGLGQMLTGIGLIAQNLANKLKSNELPGADTAQEISDMIRDADDQAHSLVRGLVPVDVESNGLEVAIGELIERIQKLHEIDIKYDSYNSNSLPLLKDNITAIHLYRIVQEAIHNAVKHAGASTITVGLQSSASCLQISIQDNGKGLDDIADMTKGMGMRLMKFRAQMIGGNLEVNSKQDEGTEIICKISNESSSLAANS